MSFINDKGLDPRSHRVAELHSLLSSLSSPHDQRYEYFRDEHQRIGELVRSRLDEQAAREGAASRLFGGLKQFVPPRGTRRIDYAQDFELVPEIKRVVAAQQHIRELDEKLNVIIQGESGAGKSLLLLELLREFDSD